MPLGVDIIYLLEPSSKIQSFSTFLIQMNLIDFKLKKNITYHPRGMISLMFFIQDMIFLEVICDRCTGYQTRYKD